MACQTENVIDIWAGGTRTASLVLPMTAAKKGMRSLGDGEHVLCCYGDSLWVLQLQPGPWGLALRNRVQVPEGACPTLDVAPLPRPAWQALVGCGRFLLRIDWQRGLCLWSQRLYSSMIETLRPLLSPAEHALGGQLQPALARSACLSFLPGGILNLLVRYSLGGVTALSCIPPRPSFGSSWSTSATAECTRCRWTRTVIGR